MPPLRTNKQVLNRASNPKATESKTQLNVAAKLTAEEMEDMDKEALIAHVMELQHHVDNIEKVTVKPASIFTPSAPATPALTAEELEAKVQQVRRVMVQGLKKQMKVGFLVKNRTNSKWSRSCKKGKARLSYMALVPEPAVFYALFNLPSDFKKKQINVSTGEFEKNIAKEWINVSARYSHLSLAGDALRIRWNKEELQFTITGMYGG